MGKVSSLEYENDILYAKSNSMDNSIHNYSRRLEQLGKQIDELNAILRIKDHEMIEMTNSIHLYKMQKDAIRKELLFRKQREDQMEGQVRKIQIDLDKANIEFEETNKLLNGDKSSSSEAKEENRRLKQAIDAYRLEVREAEELYD